MLESVELIAAKSTEKSPEAIIHKATVYADNTGILIVPYVLPYIYEKDDDLFI